MQDYGYGATGINAQIAKTYESTEGLWNMPHQNYYKNFYIPGGGAIALIFVDTTTLAPSLNK